MSLTETFEKRPASIFVEPISASKFGGIKFRFLKLSVHFTFSAKTSEQISLQITEMCLSKGTKRFAYVGYPRHRVNTNTF